jgi:transcriptional regulator with XRE-family HTH domain
MEGVKDLKFGEVLKDVRTTRNMTVRDFSDTCSISIAYICDLEKGNRKVTPQVMSNMTSNLILTEEEQKAMINAFAYDRLQIPAELLYYLIDNDLLESIKIFKEHDEKGIKVKQFAKSLEIQTK